MVENNLNLADPKDYNRKENFPRVEIVEDEAVGELLGGKYLKIMQIVRQMHDTFGLCGVLAVLASALRVDKEKYKDIYFDPIYPKELFDSWRKTSMGEDSWGWFYRQYGSRFPRPNPHRFALFPADGQENVEQRLQPRRMITYPAHELPMAHSLQEQNPSSLVGLSTNTLDKLLMQLGQNEGLSAAFLCAYAAPYSGTHTHYLSLQRPLDRAEGKVMLLGDLSPFGINAAGVTVDSNIVLNSMSRVVGAKPTTSLTAVLTNLQSNAGRAHDDEVFLTNLSSRIF